MKRLALLCLLLTALPLRADFAVPDQKITGAEQPVPLGELVALEVSPVKGPVPDLASTTVAWKVFDGTSEKKFAVDAQGRVFFGAGLVSKKLLAVAAVTHVYITADKKVASRTVLLTAEVAIGDGRPAPNPNPTPPPGDQEPEFEGDQLGLAQLSYRSALKVPAPARKRSAALAGSFTDVLGQIKAGKLSGREKILKATFESNRKALGTDLDAWEGFGKELQKKLFDLARSGQLKSDQDYVGAWQAISVGLAAVQ